MTGFPPGVPARPEIPCFSTSASCTDRASTSSGRSSPRLFDPPDEDYRVAAPVELSMDVEKVGRGRLPRPGRVATRLELRVRPLPRAVRGAGGRAVRPALRPARGETATDAEREIDEDDLATAFYRDGMLDVVELLREQFQLALPMKPLCSEACRGLCPSAARI